MFKLHIYNPEHDIALAKNLPSFTPPKAARITKERFWYIPALWADDGDWVVKPDQEHNQEPPQAPPGGEMFNGLAKVRFVTYDDLAKLKAEEMPEKVEPWGWDRLLVNTLVKVNPLFKGLVPSEEELDDIRLMSSRGFVADEVLPRLVNRDDRYVGKMEKFSSSVEELEERLLSDTDIVAKSPWSCSGRGVRFLHNPLTANDKGWVQNVISEQGYLMLEPVYNKVLDFALEFISNKNDGTKFINLNLFETNGGAYIRNIGNSNEERLQILQQYIPLELIEQIKSYIIEITSSLFNNRYSGPFGIDMMIVKTADNKTKVHPCVEMNLRRTMGSLV